MRTQYFWGHSAIPVSVRLRETVKYRGSVSKELRRSENFGIGRSSRSVPNDTEKRPRYAEKVTGGGPVAVRTAPVTLSPVNFHPYGDRQGSSGDRILTGQEKGLGKLSTGSRKSMTGLTGQF